MKTTKQYEVCFTENNQEQWFTDYITNIETARIVAKGFERNNVRSNVRILEMSNFDRTLKFIL